MSTCKKNIFKKNSWIFTTYNPPFTNLLIKYWNKIKIDNYNEFVTQAHYYTDYLRLKNTLLTSETIVWDVPLDQAWFTIMRDDLPIQLFWIDANLKKITKPIPQWKPNSGITEHDWYFNRWKSENDISSYIEYWLKNRFPFGQWYQK